MAQPNKSDLQTLDYAYLGAPFADVEAKLLNTETLNVAYKANPFVGAAGTTGTTGTNVYVNVGGVWKQSTAIYINNNGTWKTVSSVSANIAGQWKS